jgi:hypothetical protein
MSGRHGDMPSVRLGLRVTVLDLYPGCAPAAPIDDRFVPSVSHRWKAAALVAVLATVAGCGGARSKPPPVVKARDGSGTVWLCRPGLAADPCTLDLTSTAIARDGTRRVLRMRPAADPSVDCFYVYPTISGQATTNANLAVGLRQRAIALAEAARFSQVCRVYAPVYRQITLNALRHPARITRADALVAYDSVRSAFRDYLAHYNQGRGIVFIGHSQGATILTHLLRQEVDRSPPLRRRMVSALLLGGNITVRKGQSTGGDFNHIPACASHHQTGCVVAYSSFTAKPPPNSQFGRTTSDAGVRLLAPIHPSPDLRIMCVNPAALAGGSARLDPYLPSFALRFFHGRHGLSVDTPWVSFPGEYSARCESSGNATWLQVTQVGKHDRRPPLAESGDAVLGLHILDVNIALGNLVRLVRDQAAAFGR